MRVFIAILILIFSLQSWTKADDISEFEIEGISIGDSLLDYMSEDKIVSEIKRTRYMYERLTNEFGEVTKRDGLSKYYFISFFVKQKDKKFIIHAIIGTMPHVDKISECHSQMYEISNEFSTLFKNAKKYENTYKHAVDKSGKSTVKYVDFEFKSEDTVRVSCTDFEESLRIENNWIDGLDVSLFTQEVADWFTNRITY